MMQLEVLGGVLKKMWFCFFWGTGCGGGMALPRDFGFYDAILGGIWHLLTFVFILLTLWYLYERISNVVINRDEHMVKHNLFMYNVHRKGLGAALSRTLPSPNEWSPTDDV